MPINGVQIFCFFLLALLAASLASSEWTAALDLWDSRQIRNYFGDQVAEKIEAEMLQVFEEKAPGSSLKEHRLTPSDWPSIATVHREIPAELAAVITWALERGSLLNDMAHRILRRLVVLMEFDTLGFLTFCAFLIDGITDWRIKRVSFAYSSPLVHRTTLWLLGGLIGLLTMAVIAPIPFFPALIPLHIILLALALRAHVAHLPKRL